VTPCHTDTYVCMQSVVVPRLIFLHQNLHLPLQVRCQADGISAMEVLRSMLARYGMSLKLLTSLYSGFSSSACLSMAVGAVHW
jgi:hypothetical protein